jgi:hypothetical protein
VLLRAGDSRRARRGHHTLDDEDADRQGGVHHAFSHVFTFYRSLEIYLAMLQYTTSIYAFNRGLYLNSIMSSWISRLPDDIMSCKADRLA